MAQSQTAKQISETAKQMFAKYGYQGVSMRSLAEESGFGLSSIYHFFKDKDVLLEQIYKDTNKKLGRDREALPSTDTAKDMLEQLIYFQFEHIEDVVFVLKYYLHFREDFAALETKTLPAKSILHVEEVVKRGLESGEFKVADEDISAKARVVAHTINGYLLEYYPDKPNSKERKKIVEDIVSFSMAGLS